MSSLRALLAGLFLAGVCLAAPSVAMAQSDGIAEREADMFGESTETSTVVDTSSSAETIEETSGSPPRSRDDEIFGGAEEDSVSGLETILEQAEDYLDVGGFLWLRLQYNYIDAPDPASFPLISPNFSDVYLDARPNDRVRAYVRGRLRYDPTVVEGQPGAFGQAAESASVQLDQMWLKFDIGRVAFITAGKERVKWGTGRFWNPTDFLNREVLNPLDGVILFDERLGVPIIDVHIPVESLGWNFHAIANFEDAFTLNRVGGAFLGEFLLGQAEISLAAAVRNDDSVRLGAMFSAGVWLFDLRGEIAVEHKSRVAQLSGTCAPNAFIDDINNGRINPTDRPLAIEAYPEYFGDANSRSADWIPQAVLGAEVGISYSDDDAIYVGAEYFFNDAGYGDPSFYPCLIARGTFTPFYLGRHYAGVYAFIPAPGSWNDTSIVLSSLTNISDVSNVSRIDWQVRVLTFLDINAYFSTHFGDAGGEFAFATSLVPLDTSGLPPGAVASDPTLGFLASGLTIFKPIFEVGGGARLNF